MFYIGVSAFGCLYILYLAGSYNIDPLHWALMLSNAQDLASERVYIEKSLFGMGFLQLLFKR